MGTSPRSIQSLLHTAAPDIAHIAQRTRFLERIRAVLLDILPNQAGEHLRVAAYDHYRLRLHVGHGSWATRLRYMEPALVQTLAQRLRLHVDAVDIKVRPSEREQTPAPIEPRPISAASRSHIHQMATYIDDPALSRALKRLARAGTGSEPETRPPPRDAR